MRRQLVLSVMLLLCFSFTGVRSASAGEYVFETVLDQTISSSTAAKAANLAGYKEFAILARFEGKPNASFAMEVSFNNITVLRETITLNANGWLNFAKVYSVYAPNVSLAVYNPPANLKVKIMIYAGH